jgi:hypothetical protein
MSDVPLEGLVRPIVVVTWCPRKRIGSSPGDGRVMYGKLGRLVFTRGFDDGAQEAPNALRPAIGPALVVSGVMNNPPTRFGVRGASAVAQRVERPEQGAAVEDAAAATVARSRASSRRALCTRPTNPGW